MKILDIFNNWQTGSGVGNNDLYPIGLKITDNQQILEPTGYLGATPSQSGEIPFIYDQKIDVLVTPGYFYIKDREFYSYNEKITQFSNLQISGETKYIPLMEKPDGYGNISYADFINSKFFTHHEDNAGIPPILVRYYSSGDLTDNKIYMNTAVSSKLCTSNAFGYTTLNDIIISGDLESFGEYFNPMERFAKCPEYWRNENILQYNEYYYDYISNSIIIPSGDPTMEYVIEYENYNKPFMCGVELNPVKTAAGDWVLVIDPTMNSIQQVPYNITIDTSNDTTMQNLINIRVRIIDILGEPIENLPVLVSVVCDELQMSGGTESVYSSIPGNKRYPYYFDMMGPVYDIIEVETNTSIKINNTINQVIPERIINGKYIIPSYGNIISNTQTITDWDIYNNTNDILSGEISDFNCPFRPILSGDTDITGNLYCKYMPSYSITKDTDIKIQVNTYNITESKPISIVGSHQRKVLSYNNSGLNKEIRTYEPEVSGENMLIKTPYKSVFPTEIVPYGIYEYLEHIETGAALPSVLLSGVVRNAEYMKLVYPNNINRVIYQYKTQDSTINFDGRSVYVD